MALLHCEVREGRRPGWKGIGVPTVQGHKEYLGIEDRFLARKGDTYLLPVIVVGRDPRYGTFLVHLPVEADSGANRVWVKADCLQFKPDEVPA